MILSYLWTGLVGISLFCAMITGNDASLAGAAMEGAASAITLTISMAGAICLWTGVGRLMEHAGITPLLSRLLRPCLHTIFPSARTDPALASDLSANICANLLGLGNAATPMGISAAKRLAEQKKDGIASHELCRLVVLNTASIQLLPTNVAALRAACGCQTPFDILPAVWITSLCSAGLGLTAAFLMEKQQL